MLELLEVDCLWRLEDIAHNTRILTLQIALLTQVLARVMTLQLAALFWTRSLVAPSKSNRKSRRVSD